ncbi:MAG: M48 family metalloprotease [Bacteroidota bacterium]|nr:M48 family metalloprotease [Bacteroidota bacterium]
MTPALYPPSPASVPAGFTRPSGRYMGLVVAMLASIVLFVALYLLLLAAAAGLVYLTLTLHFDSYGLWTGLFHLGCVVGALMLVAFLVKAVFKRSPASQLSQHPRLNPEAHPALFAFVDQLCAEAGADRPKYICVSSDVNAAVFYEHPTLSLFWPTRKNLLIGLGLVNGLNLTEFKAVLAHEFGHFAQRSMRLGTYVNTASRLIHDMVYERDKWDDMLVQWRALDIRVSAAAWLITGLVWTVRKLMQLAYQGIHLVHASLSREMEFQADRVAVRLAGSDAMCQVLYQLAPASQALGMATGQLGLALEHQLATDDVFYHQSLYLAENLAQREQPVPVAPGEPRRLFRPDEVNVVAMYASHPADYLREEHAQAIPVPGPTDNRSAWLLFNNAAELRRTVTQRLYPEFAPGKVPEVRPAAEVEAFLAVERAEMAYHPMYGDTYEQRIITLINPDKLAELVDIAMLPPGTLAEARAALFGPALQARTAAQATRLADLQKLALFRQGQTKDPFFTVAGTRYPAAEAATVATHLERENELYHAECGDFDRQTALLYHHLFAQAPAAQREEWLTRFRFQFGIQRAYEAARKVDAEFGRLIVQIQQQGQIQQADVSRYVSEFEQLRLLLEGALTVAETVPMLPLAHLEGFANLAAFVLQDRQLPSYATFTNEWINTFLNVGSLTEERLRRLYFKNLGVLLRLQEAV